MKTIKLTEKEIKFLSEVLNSYRDRIVMSNLGAMNDNHLKDIDDLQLTIAIQLS